MDAHDTKLVDRTERGPWMQTYLGGRFFPADPQSEEVFMLDIAHALSNICRYNGMVSNFYSVAQHSVILSQYAEVMGYSRETQIIALMHDAAEAYLGDHIVSLKAICPELRAIEARIWPAIEERFSLTDIGEAPKRMVKSMDKRICLNEKAALMAGGFAWIIQSLEPLNLPPIVAHNPYIAKDEFLARVEFLGIREAS